MTGGGGNRMTWTCGGGGMMDAGRGGRG
jgi:hypothetical protein